MKTNRPTPTAHLTTHGGGQAVLQRPENELERAVATCLLFENTFYEQGNDIAARIASLCPKVGLDRLVALARKARTDWKLRHAPLFLLVQAAQYKEPGQMLSTAITDVIQRPDEMGELLSLYWRNGRTPISAAVKRGLAQAFTKFGEYQLAKWNRDAAIRLRDVLFLCHAKPKDAEQEALWKRLIAGTMATPDTWEVALSAGTDKKATWKRLLTDKRLGYMALLQNLRNMIDAQVDLDLIQRALLAGAKGSKALPFRFVTAARYAPRLAEALSGAMLSALEDAPRLHGRTALVVDVSGSMDNALSGSGETTRLEAAGALAVLLREICETVTVWTFSQRLEEVAAYRGLPLLAGINQSQEHGGTYLKAALEHLKPKITADRVIVVTDEQSHDGLRDAWTTYAYLMNVAPYQPGLDVSRGWTRINGFSERVVDWIHANEAQD